MCNGVLIHKKFEIIKYIIDYNSNKRLTLK